MPKFIQFMLSRLSGKHTPQAACLQENESHCGGYIFISSKASSNIEARLTMHALTGASGTVKKFPVYAVGSHAD